ncbi:MAG: thiolase family protein [Gammaproteobacteria bacterium]
MAQDIFIVAARRTPNGSFLGALSPLSATELGALAIQAVVSEAGIALGAIEEVLMGCVLPAGLGQAPARQAALKAGIPQSVPCTTVNKMCGSGMKTVMLAHDLIKAGSAEIVLAGGMESMSNAPYLLAKARAGMRMGHQQVLDHMLYDGLQDPQSGELMGYFAELCAEKYGFTREQQDHYAAESVRRSIAAMECAAFGAEIIPVESATKGKTLRVTEDEQPRKCDLARIGHMRPAFKEGGTVTAANASSISDGAAALLLMSAQAVAEHGLTPIARLLGHAAHARAPAEFTVAPIDAIRRLQQRLGWATNDVDLYEINEAFAVVAMAALRDLGLEHAKVNVNGGACALGHPIGASGARIIVTLVHALKQRGSRRGIAALCIGGGEATAVGIEVV